MVVAAGGWLEAEVDSTPSVAPTWYSPELVEKPMLLSVASGEELSGGMAVGGRLLIALSRGVDVRYVTVTTTGRLAEVLVLLFKEVTRVGGIED